MKRTKRKKRPTFAKSPKKTKKAKATKPVKKTKKGKRRITEYDAERAFNKKFGGGGPPKGAKNRSRKRGQTARDYIENANQRQKRKLTDLETAIDLADRDEIDQRSFINLVLALGWKGTQAYTFWFSPP